MSSVSFGLDVGTSSTKGIAVGPEGEVLAVEEEDVPARHPAARMGRAGPARLVAASAGGPRPPARARRRAGRHRPRRADARPRRAGRAGRGGAPGDPLERRPHRGRVRGDRGAGRPRAADLPHRQPRADRLHGAQAAVAAQARARELRADRAHHAARRTTCGCGCAASTRSTSRTPPARCCFDVARRRWSDEVVGALELDPAWLPRALESPEVSGETADGIPVAAGAGDQAAGALGVGVDRPGPLSVVLGTSGVVFAALPEFHADPAGARARLLPRGAGRVARDGRDALRGRLAALAARRRRARRGLRRAGRGGGPLGARAPRGSRSSRTWPASARRTPTRTRAASFTGLSLRHDRGALVRAVLEGVAYGLRDSLDLLVELGVEAGARARLGRRRTLASCGCGSSPRCSSCRSSGSRSRRARPTARRCSAAWPAGCGRTSARPCAACVRTRGEVEPDPEWIAPYAEGRETFRALYPALRAPAAEPALRLRPVRRPGPAAQRVGQPGLRGADPRSGAAAAPGRRRNDATASARCSVPRRSSSPTIAVVSAFSPASGDRRRAASP